jgi:hypothetical protein
MERKQFLCRTLHLGLGSCGLLALANGMAGAADNPPDELTMALRRGGKTCHFVAHIA